jgi:hypothetical protein
MELIEYKTVAWIDDAARVLGQLNELGAQGWEVCAQGKVKTGSAVIGRVNPRHDGQVLVLKRHKAA